MTREEAVKILQATRLMLMDGANQPISDLYYALDMAIEALEQTEPSNSEKPNNCEPKICDTCRYYNSNIPCGSTPSACKEADKFAKEFVDGLKKLKLKVEPTCSKMEQVDKDINVRSKDEPQTCSVNGRPYDCGKCEYFRCTADEPQTEVVMPYERMRGLYTGYRKTEQTERRK